MRILFITDGFPYPLTSGYLRHYNLILALSKKHDITLFSAVDSSYKEEHCKAMQPYTKRIMTFLSKATKSKSISKRLVKAFRTLLGRNQVITDMRNALEELLKEETFDIVLLAGEYTYHVVKGLDTPPIISDMCDAYSVRTKGRMKHVRRVTLPALWIKYQDLRRIEQRVVEMAKLVLFASQRDAVIVPADASEKIVILPNGVDTGYWHRSAPELGQNTMIFTGAMHYPPNRDAALHLIHEILPLVRQSIPDVKLLIVGHSPSPELVEAGNQPGVTVTGFVEDMRPYLEQSTVFAAPLRFGSGIQNKVLEALAMELPIVTTTVVEAGLRTLKGEKPPVTVADTTSEFVQAIIKELNTRSTNPKPFTEGKEFVEENFVWASSAERLEQAIDKILSVS